MLSPGAVTFKSVPLLVPRPHQREATLAILAARATKRPGFLLGDMTGLGKTLAVWCAVAAMPEREMLIVCPKGAIPQWRRTIALAGLPEKAVAITNCERTKSLMAPPAESKRQSTRAKNNKLAKHGGRSRHGRLSSSTKPIACGIPMRSRPSSASSSRAPRASRYS